jgi:hypothetical protein
LIVILSNAKKESECFMMLILKNNYNITSNFRRLQLNIHSTNEPVNEKGEAKLMFVILNGTESRE